MEVEYELTPEDLIAFPALSLRQNAPLPARAGPANALVVGLMFIALATAGMYFLFSDDPTAEWYLRMIPFVVLGAALALLGMLLYVRFMASRLLVRALKQGRNAQKFLGWRRVSIDAEAIRNTSEFAASTYLWHGIDKFGATLDHAFFYINTTTAVVVPRLAFPDDRAFKEFVDTARSYYRMGDTAGGEVGPRPDDARSGPADDRIVRGESGRS